MKRFRLIWLFYKGFCFASWLITLACLFLSWEYGYSIYTVLFWFRIATLWIIYTFIRSYKSREFYYYQNLGVSKRLLWGVTLGFEMVMYLFLIHQVNKLR